MGIFEIISKLLAPFSDYSHKSRVFELQVSLFNFFITELRCVRGNFPINRKLSVLLHFFSVLFTFLVIIFGAFCLKFFSFKFGHFFYRINCFKEFFEIFKKIFIKFGFIFLSFIS